VKSIKRAGRGEAATRGASAGISRRWHFLTLLYAFSAEIARTCCLYVRSAFFMRGAIGRRHDESCDIGAAGSAPAVQQVLPRRNGVPGRGHRCRRGFLSSQYACRRGW